MKSALAALAITRLGPGFQLQAIAAVAPLLTARNGYSHAEIGALVGLYMLPGVFASLAGGYAATRFGDRRMLAASLVLMAAGGALTTFAPGFFLAASGRLVAGVGGVVVNMLCLKMGAERAPPGFAASITGLMLTMYPLGIALSLSLLAPFASAYGIAAALMVPAVFSAGALALVPVTSAAYVPKADSPGGPQAPPLEWRIVLSYAAAWGVFNAGVATLAAFLPDYLVAQGLSPAAAGAQASLATFALALMTVPGGLVSDRTGRPALIAVTGAALAALAIIALPHAGASASLIILCGALLALPPGPIAACLSQSVAPENRARAFGIHGAGSSLGIGLLPPLAGLTRDLSGLPEMPIYCAAAAIALTAQIFLLAEAGRKPQ